MLLGPPGTDEHGDADAYGQIVVLCEEQLCPFITAPSFVQHQLVGAGRHHQSGHCSLFSALASLATTRLGIFNSGQPPSGRLNRSISICFKL